MDNQPNGNVSESQGSSGYGKRPLWQWVLIYLVLGGVAYAAIYYFFLAGNGGYRYGPSNDAEVPATGAGGY